MIDYERINRQENIQLWNDQLAELYNYKKIKLWSIGKIVQLQNDQIMIVKRCAADRMKKAGVEDLFFIREDGLPLKE